MWARNPRSDCAFANANAQSDLSFLAIEFVGNTCIVNSDISKRMDKNKTRLRLCVGFAYMTGFTDSSSR